MQVISALCGWLFFIAFIALIVGLIKPRLVVRWGNVKTRKRVGLIYGVTALIAVIIGASTQPSTPATVPPSTNNSTTATGPGPSSNATSSKNTTSTNNTPSSSGGSAHTNTSAPTSNATSPKNTPTPPSTVTQPMVYSLGMTPDQFRKNFNSAASQDGSDLAITSLSVDNSGVQGTFKYMFTDSLGVIGSVNKKDGSLRDVMLAGQGDGTFQSGANIIIGIGLLIQATNPNLSADQRGQIVRNLGLTDKNADLTNIDKSTTNNGLKYSLSSSSYMGLMFDVANANDN